MIKPTLIYDNEPSMIEWASGRIGFTPQHDVKAIGWGTPDTLKAVVLWDNFGASDVSIHVASCGHHWLKPALLVAAFSHPFVQWDKRRVSAYVPSKNTKALKLDLHLGFNIEGRLKHGLPDDDLIVLGMLREECRFIHPSYRTPTTCSMK